MARTHNITKARESRKLLDNYLDAVNSGDGREDNKMRADIQALNIDGARYGNKRKHMAETKVLERRVERKRLNRKVDDE